ncbi:NUDIX hydrolase [Ramlibacter tataouinensis]|uniref:NUDIX hydrolase n=1 Tax=Ramlibacter tataouinensis TaxID=94132 RepID=A0A127JZ70_9BURK|nr:NUDIX hydrolase [Ramlibacter tataouinensis]
MNLEALDQPARDSATVVMLRDGAQGLEVFLVKRHGLSDVLGGAYVFPGGKVDATDALAARSLDAAGAELRVALAEPGLADEAVAALYFAALRELFEETGVLLAQGAGAAEAEIAWRMMREGRALDEVLAPMALQLAATRLQPWSRWITPVVGGVVRKRFDARFFLARAPEGQTPRHDEHEATESCWLTPREALRQYWEGEIELAPPQIMSLAHLSRHAGVDSAMAEARARTPPLVEPEPFELQGVRVICYPGDERHSVRARALPGPTRLHWRGGRFEPEGGLADLFADA